MVTTLESPRTATAGPVSWLIVGYAVLTAATVVVCAVLTGTAPAQAPSEAWVHAVIVAVLAAVLLIRWRAARHGSAGGRRAVRVICAVLLVANVVEACVPAFPVWMRIEMVLIAVLMLAVSALLVRGTRSA